MIFLEFLEKDTCQIKRANPIEVGPFCATPKCPGKSGLIVIENAFVRYRKRHESDTEKEPRSLVAASCTHDSLSLCSAL